ncbi:hypothetical protein DACRYDRAFT_118140 [Dacryopinax primogenitus]|uniref:Uncharacterized protein n=1 Tax=Dacryopinax primogenitus (strain DJM 731) TaxID=1858805 RepID=M5FQX7_DACPD|nr:uncharacterized protein DACRYDRAFT_118140 [Dacryopinax primogenitus]EJT99415.1 hypothetical protein DACRYDRAFT_118140 [Dacryopinax primogenitus]
MTEHHDRSSTSYSSLTSGIIDTTKEHAASEERARKRSLAKVLFGASAVFFVTGIAGALVYARRAQVRMLEEDQRSKSETSTVEEPPSPTETRVLLQGTNATGPQPLVLPSRISTSSTGAPRLSLPRRPPKTAPANPLAISPIGALGAFGLATLTVVGVAGGVVWAVKKSIGVDDMEGFTGKTRLMLRSLFPGLSERIHRAITPRDNPSSVSSHSPSSTFASSSSHPLNVEEEAREWNVVDSQQRLTDAFAQGGIMRWAEQAGSELEAERVLEARKRAVRKEKRKDGTE